MRPTSWIARICLKLAKCGIYKSSSFTTVSYQGMTSVLPTEPKMFAGFSPCGKSAFSIPLSTIHCYFPLVSFHRNPNSSAVSLTSCVIETPELCPAFNS